MWLLRLNDMRSSNIENLTDVCIADTYEALESFIVSEQCEPYRDNDRWHKTFKKGSLLEWFNYPGYAPAFVDIGTQEDWESRARDDYRELINSLTHV